MGGKCPIETTLSLINGKWKLLILKELSQGAVRYGKLGAAIPAVSAKVLTQQLRELDEDGLIVRTVYAEVPPRVEYSLSDMGASIFSVFKELRRWGLEDDGLARGECSFCGQCIPIHGKEKSPQPEREE
ncbi:winged helix-turn-helix transcriptional regulator [Aminivibrio sp.]|jgi:DNA-binding HxlR family transcriptional regulator|uniref:winged helix-turn-helix transcriptional regulator n=1 Tax=Aminivibrio sp. TaxID=1872489 RepID=UPI001D68651A|nr:transcriptional regulator [Synergistales bacterium]